MRTMEWKKSLSEAIEEARGGTRLPLLVFTSKGCAGSEKTMNEVLTDEAVIAAIERDCVPVRVDAGEDLEMAERFRVGWTPAFVVCDEEGNALERWEGYIPSGDFIPQLILAKGLSAFHLGRHEEAVREFGMLVEDYPGSELVPEAEYYLGAATFKLTGETNKLSEVCRDLIMTHPESTWTKRCSLWGRDSNYLRPFVGYSGGGSAGSGAY